MNKVILQLWEESNSNGEFLSDGCTLHINSTERNEFVANIYKNRGEDIPENYDRIVGEYLEVFVNDKLYNLLMTEKNMKIPESSFQNLIKLEEIIFDKSKI